MLESIRSLFKGFMPKEIKKTTKIQRARTVKPIVSKSLWQKFKDTCVAMWEAIKNFFSKLFDSKEVDDDLESEIDEEELVEQEKEKEQKKGKLAKDEKEAVKQPIVKKDIPDLEEMKPAQRKKDEKSPKKIKGVDRQGSKKHPMKQDQGRVIQEVKEEDVLPLKIVTDQLQSALDHFTKNMQLNVKVDANLISGSNLKNTRFATDYINTITNGYLTAVSALQNDVAELTTDQVDKVIMSKIESIYNFKNFLREASLNGLDPDVSPDNHQKKISQFRGVLSAITDEYSRLLRDYMELVTLKPKTDSNQSRSSSILNMDALSSTDEKSSIFGTIPDSREVTNRAIRKTNSVPDMKKINLI